MRMRKIGFWLSVAVLFVFGGTGVQNFVKDWALPETPFQRVVVFGQLFLGIAGISAVVGASLKRRWTGGAAIATAFGLAFVAGGGAMAWGEGVFKGILDGGVGFLIGFLPYLGVRNAGRSELTRESSPPQDSVASKE